MKKPATEVLPIRMETAVIKEIKEKATEKGLAASSFARMLIHEGLKKVVNS